MKEYIKPSAKTILLHTEAHLLDGSNVFEEGNDNPALSNRRHVSIWDNDEE